MQMLGSQFLRVLKSSLKSSVLRSSFCWIRMWVPRLSPGEWEANGCRMGSYQFLGHLPCEWLHLHPDLRTQLPYPICKSTVFWKDKLRASSAMDLTWT